LKLFQLPLLKKFIQFPLILWMDPASKQSPCL
jgi:hypothetical protein